MRRTRAEHTRGTSYIGSWDGRRGIGWQEFLIDDNFAYTCCYIREFFGEFADLQSELHGLFFTFSNLDR